MTATGEAILVREYERLAYAIASDYFLPGGDRDDVKQEALVGLLSGIRAYRPGQGLTEPQFYALAIRRQIITKLKQANKLRAVPLNDALRLGFGGWADDGGAHPWLDVRSDPAAVLERAERLRDFVAAFQSLSELEKSSLRLSYDDGHYMQRPDSKRIDNALWRARKRLRAAA